MSENNEFVSKLEEVMPAIELNFEPTPGFGKYKKFLEHAISHPAKANTNLLEFLIKNFTKEGDTVLDPMAGSGSLGVIASLHNRNAIQIDIEKKFYEFMEEARRKVEKEPSLTPKGTIINICGDARKLSELLSQVDTIITSPPYLKSADHGAGINKQRDGDVRIGCSTVGRTVESKDAIDNVKEYGSIDTIITSPPYANTTACENPNIVELQQKGFVKEGDMTKFLPTNLSKDNISNLPFVDTIITSPPYSSSDMRKSKLFLKMREQPNSNWYNRSLDGNAVKYYLSDGYESKENIGNLPYVDVVITSPPYAGTSGGKGERSRKPINERYPGLFERCIGGNKGALSKNPSNIDNLPYVDTIITSPPYENQLHDSHEERVNWKGHEIDKKKNLPVGYSPNPNNIGNMRRETYLEAMFKVYSECYKVLKHGGRAIVIVKPFIRNKKVVDLPYHTYILLTKCGFVLEKLYKLRLKQMSFWRRLYYEKYKDVPLIAHEYVIVVRKP